MNLLNRHIHIQRVVLMILLFSMRVIVAYSIPVDLFEFSKEPFSPEANDIYRQKDTTDNILFAQKININFSAIYKEDSIQISLDGEQIVVRKINTVTEVYSNYSYHAYESEKAEISLSILKDNINGIIISDFGTFFIETWGKDYVLVRRIDIPILDSDISLKEYSDSTRWLDTTLNINRSITNVIRVAVLYTNKALYNYNNNTISFLNAVNADIKNANQSLINSNINARLELAYVGKTNDVEGSFTYEQILDKFRDTNDGYMDEIHTLRNLYNADICIAYVDTSSIYCGMSTTISTSDYAFAVIGAHNMCSGVYSLTHEIGHILGCGHDLSAPSNSSYYAEFGHGYVHYVPGAPSSSWRTVMAYSTCCNNNSYCKLIKYWSDPTMTYHGNVLGTDSCNNKLVWLLRGPIVSAFYSNPQNILAWSLYVPNDMLYSNLQAEHNAYLLSDYTLGAGKTVDVVAHDTIRLLPNTHIVAGADFHASIYPHTRTNLSIGKMQKTTRQLFRSQNNEEVTISPNPAYDILNINIELNSSKGAYIRMTILNSLGQIYDTTPLQYVNDTHWTYTLSVQHLPSGVYFIETTINQQTFINKLIVQ